MGFWVWSYGLGVWGMGFRGWELGFGVWGLGVARSAHLRLECLLVELALPRLRLLHHLVHEALPRAAELAVRVVAEAEQPALRGEHERVEVARVHLGPGEGRGGAGLGPRWGSARAKVGVRGRGRCGPG